MFLLYPLKINVMPYISCQIDTEHPQGSSSNTIAVHGAVYGAPVSDKEPFSLFVKNTPGRISTRDDEIIQGPINI